MEKLFTSVAIFLLLSLSLLCLYRGTISIPPSSFELPLVDVNLPQPADVTSFPVCDSRLTEHIPCHDRDLIRQLKLKPNVSLMEHYERHCPPPHRRLNCLVPPAHGYKIPIEWPASRDEVWKANIPHIHLAAEKSDQNWMVISGDRIRFPGGGTHFHAGADKYVAAIAKGLTKEIWQFRMMHYWKQMNPVIEKHTFRNVMDMSANFGGFAAALNSKDVWVMNVVPVKHSSKLKIVYDRGLIGTVHDWCESFSTYPRTYDLLHAWLVFSELKKDGCSSVDLLIEMDRILRPHGIVIIRDKLDRINYVRKLLRALRWDGWYSEVEPGMDALSLGEEWILIARKKL